MPVMTPLLPAAAQSIHVPPGLAAAMWLNALNASMRNYPTILSWMGMFFSKERSSAKKEGPK